MARLRAASFGNREAFGPFVLVECVQGDLEAIRFVAGSGQRPGRVDAGLGSGVAGVDAQKFRIITRLLVAQRASVIVEVLDTLARRAREICQSKKTSVIGRSSHCTVHPEIMKRRIMMNANPAANIVLVHGGFVDGSGWRPVYDLLTQDGYHVAVLQNPTLSLQGDAAATRLVIDAQDPLCQTRMRHRSELNLCSEQGETGTTSRDYDHAGHGFRLGRARWCRGPGRQGAAGRAAEAADLHRGVQGADRPGIRCPGDRARARRTAAPGRAVQLPYRRLAEITRCRRDKRAGHQAGRAAGTQRGGGGKRAAAQGERETHRGVDPDQSSA